MNKFISLLTASMLSAAVNTLAFAEEKDTPQPPKPPHEGMAGMGGMHGMSDEQMDAHMRQMQESMLKNHDFMHRIRDAKDEKEQARLKEEWLQAMKLHMKTNQVPQQLKMHGMPEHGAPKK